jgi:outer membrane protein OmpA-like peptidoglycan-associated protein
MSRILNASKLFMAMLVSVALTGSIQAAGTSSLDACSDAMYGSPRAIEDAQTILEQNQYLAPGSYEKGELDQTTIGAIVHFQGAHTLRKTGALNFETTALLCSHAIAPQTAVAAAVVTSPTYVYMPAIVYRPTSEPLFVEKRPLILEGVEFDIDKATLRPESRATLDQVAESLKNWPDVMVEIQGHTSEPGTAVHNMELSQRRAEAVRTYFVSEGIDGGRLVANGYGETRFIADNSTAEGRQENRRVELHEIR